ncbi:transcriptional regulatory protein AlgP-like [Penaeus indicus]|uniref:transcriptional regulatory protein AlgP-like n=1 Tax=Penaeus indicus TaxID=29960 RepID=UPI00300C6BD0
MMRFLCLTSVLQETVPVVSKQRNARKANAAAFLEGDATGLATMEKLQKKIFVLETVFAASKTRAPTAPGARRWTGAAWRAARPTSWPSRGSAEAKTAPAASRTTATRPSAAKPSAEAAARCATRARRPLRACAKERASAASRPRVSRATAAPCWAAAATPRAAEAREPSRASATESTASAACQC